MECLGEGVGSSREMATRPAGQVGVPPAYYHPQTLGSRGWEESSPGYLRKHTAKHLVQKGCWLVTTYVHVACLLITISMQQGGLQYATLS